MQRKIQWIVTLLAWVMVGGVASADIESVEIDGEQRHFTLTKIPEDVFELVVGEYLYEGKEAPIVRLNRDGTGVFQPHTKQDVTIKWWIQSEADGTLEMLTPPNGNRVMVLIYQIQESPANLQRSWAPGSYSRSQLAIWKEPRRVTISGERQKPY